MERHGRRARLRIDGHLSEVLQPVAGRAVARRRGRGEHGTRTEGRVECTGAGRGAGVERAGDELPERIEVGVGRLRRIVAVGRGVVDVGGDEQHVADAPALQRRQQRGDLVLAAERARIAVGDALLHLAVGHDQPDRLVAGDDLPGGRRSCQRVLQPGALRCRQDCRVRAGLGLQVGRVRAAMSPQVEDEHVGQRAAAHQAVDLPRIAAGAAGTAAPTADRGVVEERLPRPRDQHVDVLLAVAGLHAGGPQHLARIPVVQHLVVVPLRDHRDLGVEGPQVGVAQVVTIAAAELIERLGDVADAVRDQVAPGRAVVELHRFGNRPVGVDQVAGVDEQIRLDGPHRRERLHAAARFVEAPALAADVTAPHDPDRRGRPAGRPERAADRLAHGPVGPLEARVVDDPLARGQAGQVEPGSEIGRRRGRDRDALARAGQRVRRRVADAQPRRAVGAAPHDRAIRLDVAALDAGGDDRPRRGVGPDGRRGLRQQRGRRRQVEEAPAGDR